MAEFLEQRISAAIAYGSSWADEYDVQITRTAGGGEYRKLVHPYPVRRFRLIYRADRADVGAKVKNLYDRCYGKFSGFRVKALDDFTTAADGRSAPTKDDQTLLYVSSGVYQLRKEYGKDQAGLAIGRPFRTIFKPVAGTVVVAKNGVLLSSGVSVDTTTGRVTISPAPSYPADVITGGCQFDIPVRFDTTVDVDQLAPNHRQLNNVELVELLAP
jgi:uncharacterized protein (TIGR02217 family)